MGITKSEGRAFNNSGSVSWQTAPLEFTRRSGVMLEIWGPTGSGRTSLALSAPDPIAYIYFHEKVDGIVQKFSNNKDIRMFKAGGVFRGESDEIRSKAWAAMQEFESAYYDSFSWARTTIVDTHNEAWYLERLAEFGAPKPDKGRIDRNYGPVNNRWMSMINMARTQERTNVIFVGQTEDEWKEGERGNSFKTGRVVRVATSASNQVLLKSDISVRTDKRDGKFISKIHKGWWNAESEDEELENEFSTFGMVLATVTETSPDEWLRK